jgi:hypothetical protein
MAVWLTGAHRFFCIGVHRGSMTSQAVRGLFEKRFNGPW